jgi:hypothetical protein
MEEIQKSRIFGLLALIARITAVTGSDYYRFLFPLGTVLWFGFAAATFHFYKKGI